MLFINNIAVLAQFATMALGEGQDKEAIVLGQHHTLGLLAVYTDPKEFRSQIYHFLDHLHLEGILESVALGNQVVIHAINGGIAFDKEDGVNLVECQLHVLDQGGIFFVLIFT
jgi:hypothetical protein